MIENNMSELEIFLAGTLRNILELHQGIPLSNECVCKQCEMIRSALLKVPVPIVWDEGPDPSKWSDAYVFKFAKKVDLESENFGIGNLVNRRIKAARKLLPAGFDSLTYSKYWVELVFPDSGRGMLEENK